MNGNPDAGLEYWNKYAAENDMIPFDYSDETWYRNEQYVVVSFLGKYVVETIDRYEIVREKFYKAFVDGEPCSNWCRPLSAAIQGALEFVRKQEEKGLNVEPTNIFFFTKLY